MQPAYALHAPPFLLSVSASDGVLARMQQLRRSHRRLASFSVVRTAEAVLRRVGVIEAWVKETCSPKRHEGLSILSQQTSRGLNYLRAQC